MAKRIVIPLGDKRALGTVSLIVAAVAILILLGCLAAYVPWWTRP